MLTLTQLDITFLSGALLVVTLYAIYNARHGDLPYPPGPKRFPIIGNLLDMLSHNGWFTYRKWSDEYGTVQPSCLVVEAHQAELVLRFRDRTCRCRRHTYDHCQLDQGLY
jgi:hypothetical protein